MNKPVGTNPLWESASGAIRLQDMTHAHIDRALERVQELLDDTNASIEEVDNRDYSTESSERYREDLLDRADTQERWIAAFEGEQKRRK